MKGVTMARGPEVHINGWLQIIIWISSTNGKQAIILDYKTETKPTVSEIGYILADFWARYANTIKAALNVNYNVDYLEGKTRWVDTPNYQNTYFPPQPQAGASAGEAAPSSAACVITKKSGARGRSYNGRLYAGAMGEAVINHDTVISGWLSILNAMATAFASFRSASGYSGSLQWVVASQKLHILTAIAGFVIDAYLDSQRRRLTGRGN